VPGARQQGLAVGTELLEKDRAAGSDVTGIGATKSLTSAVKGVDERLLRKVRPKASQLPAGKILAVVTPIAVSPN
jgi:hypothetical protein